MIERKNYDMEDLIKKLVKYNRTKKQYEVTFKVWNVLVAWFAIGLVIGIFTGQYFILDLFFIILPNDMRLLIRFPFILIGLPFIESYIWHKGIINQSEEQKARYKDKKD